MPVQYRKLTPGERQQLSFYKKTTTNKLAMAECSFCGASFAVSAWQSKALRLDSHARVFCCDDHRYSAMRKPKVPHQRKVRSNKRFIRELCGYCGNEFELSPYQRNLLNHDPNVNLFCSQNCINLGKRKNTVKITFVGQRFGKLVVIEEIEKRSERLFRCQCDCGNFSIVAYSRLKADVVHSCGCIKEESISRTKLPPMFPGQRFTRLILIKKEGRRGHNIYWLCKCDCGNEKTISQFSIARGITLSCGCLGREHFTSSRITHGLSKTNEYSIWKGMIGRCHNTRSMHYIKYGARGIYVCNEWRESFENFYQDMGQRPSKKHSIDRIDPFGPYSKENCRWATSDIQANNVRQRAMIKHRTFSVAQLARAFKLRAGLVLKRLNNDWTIYDALTIPRNEKISNVLITFRDVTLSISDWARIIDIDVNTLRSRLNNGYTIENALTMKTRPWPGKRRAEQSIQLRSFAPNDTHN